MVCRLEEQLSQPFCPAAARALARPGEDAVWVRGRAQRLFFIPNTTEHERPEKSCFGGSFVALLSDDGGAYYCVPFECSDYYGRAGLKFSSEDAPPESLQRRIAAAFWGLLLLDSTDLEDYQDTLYHSGAGVTLMFGVKDGDPFLEERTGEDEH